jgi:hypothetical protein
LGFLQWLANFCAHGLGICDRRQACHRNGSSETDSGHYQAKMGETKLNHGVIFFLQNAK